MKRREIFAGNWKMYKTCSEAVTLATELIKGIKSKEGREYVIFPPFTALKSVGDVCKESILKIGAQNMYHEKEGAFTGEISPVMIKDCGADFVLLGHSERRHIFHETDSAINKKIKAALNFGLKPMVCVGELLEEREAGKTNIVLESQIKGAFDGLLAEDMKNISIAYEPVWAIGTGKVATPEIAEDAHVVIRKYLAELFGQDIAKSLPILYGGSVKPDNIEGLYAMENIDGVLVGGASLDASSFLKILNV